MRHVAAFSLLLTHTMAAIVSGCGQEAESRPPSLPGPPERDTLTAAAKPWPRLTLRAEQTWQLNLPRKEPFDASGLCLGPNGELWTVNDKRAALYRIQWTGDTNSADLVEVRDCFNPGQLSQLTGSRVPRFDFEGVARDEQGKIYVCAESGRQVLRCDPRTGTVESLAIDWKPVQQYFDPSDLNASFEGIAVLGETLFVANERQRGRIITVDLGRLRVRDSFFVRPSGSNARDIHYSDLSVFEGVLHVLLRESRCILAVDPVSHQVLVEYNFKEMERQPEVLYRSLFPTGQMEGLAVERDYIWLVTDNNGTGRARAPTDTRPTLFKCRRAAPPKL